MTTASHGRYPYSYLADRPDYTWPDGKRLAFYVATNLECFTLARTGATDASALRPRDYAAREYGVRVGAAYMLEMFDQLGIRVAHNVNSGLYDQCPQMFARIRARGDEIIGHGRSNSERQDRMSETEETAMIREVTAAISQHEGNPPAGWLSPARAGSDVTPDLLAEAGYRYLLDWPCDDQPVWMRTRAGRILLVPYPLLLNDGREHGAREFGDLIVDHFNEMLRQSQARPLVCAVALHPFLSGQAARLNPLRRALEHCVRHAQRERVWYTLPAAIADYCRGLPPGIIPAA